MQVGLAYGRGTLTVDLPEDRTTVIEPVHSAGLPDERAGVLSALDNPIAAPPLRKWLRPGATVCIVFTDITRATPNERIIPWLLEYLKEVPPEQITLLNSLGTHRPNTPAELERMLGAKVLKRYRVVNHEPENPEALVQLGATGDGTPALLNRILVESDVRIITGFIEPHFFAGFSGGPKGIMPGVAGLQTVMSHHGSRNLGHPKATFGITSSNPLWDELLDIALRPGPSFLLNVTLNDRREITGVFAGDMVEAHRAGCEFVRTSAMRRCDEPFDAVIATNSGYPLDLNLYQGVKGLSAAARIVKTGGTIVLACECSDGVPEGSSYERLLRRARDPQDLLKLLAQPGFSWPEQWQAQIQAQVQGRARVLLHSSLPQEIVRAVHLEPCPDITAAVRTFPEHWRIAVLPLGPLTIPYLA